MKDYKSTLRWIRADLGFVQSKIVASESQNFALLRDTQLFACSFRNPVMVRLEDPENIAVRIAVHRCQGATGNDCSSFPIAKSDGERDMFSVAREMLFGNSKFCAHIDGSVDCDKGIVA